jgi:hypothetical protein
LTRNYEVSSNSKEKTERNTFPILDEILNQKITLETDLMDFLLIKGIGRPDLYDPKYEEIGLEKRAILRQYLNQKRKSYPKGINQTFGMFGRGLSRYYPSDFKTIRDFKEYLERNGLTGGIVGSGLAKINKFLEEFNIEEIRVGGTTPSWYLKKHGLKRV